MEREAILESKIEVLKADRNLWEFHARQLAKLCVNYGMISRGRFAEIMRIDRCDVDYEIEKYRKEIGWYK